MITSQDELGAWLRLSLTEGVGNEAIRRLLAAFGLPAALFGQSESALRQVVPARQARALQQEPEGWRMLLDDTWAWLQAPDVPGEKEVQRAIVTWGDSDYPAALLDIPDPPMFLYALGQTAGLANLTASNCIAMVGSRNPTPQGTQNAQAFAQTLSAAGLTVVSGWRWASTARRMRARCTVLHPKHWPPSPWLARVWTGSTPNTIWLWPTALPSKV